MNPTLTLNDVKVGQRVQLTHANGDTAEVTIVRIGLTGTYFDGPNNSFFIQPDTWTITKILHKPLPTEPGLYAPTPTADNQVYLVLTAQGKWHWIDWSYNGSFYSAEDHVAMYADTMEAVFLK